MIEALSDAGAFIFDLDGMLLDNIPAHMRAWATFLAALGHEIDEAQFIRQYSGQSNADILRGVLGPQLSQNEVDAECERKETICRDLYRPHMKPVAGLTQRFNWFLCALCGLCGEGLLRLWAVIRS